MAPPIVAPEFSKNGRGCASYLVIMSMRHGPARQTTAATRDPDNQAAGAQASGTGGRRGPRPRPYMKWATVLLQIPTMTVAASTEVARTSKLRSRRPRQHRLDGTAATGWRACAPPRKRSSTSCIRRRMRLRWSGVALGPFVATVNIKADTGASAWPGSTRTLRRSITASTSIWSMGRGRDLSQALQ